MLDLYKDNQKIAYKILTNAISKNKNSHAYLFETNGYSESNNFVQSFIKFLLCEKHYTNGDKCDKCDKCTIIDNNNHPEIKIINPEGQWIKKEQLTELQNEFNKKAIVGDKKIYAINQAEKMNVSAVNSILKFLEEPEDNIIAILITDNRYQILETILSRCQTISLIKETQKEGQTIKEKIANYLFSLEENKQSFLNNEKTEDIINKALAFVDYYEKYGTNTIVYINNLWTKTFNAKDSDDEEKNLFEIGLNILLLYYKDILNYKLNRDIEVFINHDSNIKTIAEKNTFEKLSYKIKKIIEALNKIKYNINKNLIMDKLIIEMDGEKI